MAHSSRRPEVLIFEGEAKAVLPAAESFARQGFRVVVGSSQRYCFGFHSRFCRERIVMPDQRHAPDKCVGFLLDLVRRRRFEMILPLGDEATELVCRHRDEFMKYTKLVLVPYDTFIIGRDKVRTMQAAEACGVPIPRTFDPEQTGLDEIASAVQYPVLVKPAFSNGARGIHYAHSRQEMTSLYHQVAAEFGRTFIQEFIPHTGLQYKTELLLDYDGRVLAAFAYEKIRFYPPSAGSSTLNRSIYYPEMVEHSIRLARGIGWFGMCDFDWIYDTRDKRPKLMEINPRVTDTIRIADYCGVDFFKMLYQMACGEKVEPVLTYRTGLYVRFLPGELMWFLTAGPKRWHTKPSFLRFFGCDVKYLVTSLSDPGPILAYFAGCMRTLLDPRERAYRLRLGKAKPEDTETAATHA